jgi:hypothetical protein
MLPRSCGDCGRQSYKKGISKKEMALVPEMISVPRKVRSWVLCEAMAGETSPGTGDRHEHNEFDLREDIVVLSSKINPSHGRQ